MAAVSQIACIGPASPWSLRDNTALAVSQSPTDLKSPSQRSYRSATAPAAARRCCRAGLACRCSFATAAAPARAAGCRQLSVPPPLPPTARASSGRRRGGHRTTTAGPLRPACLPAAVAPAHATQQDGRRSKRQR
eukprot:293940-Chlamydomonas_euryale.AAC.1